MPGPTAGAHRRLIEDLSFLLLAACVVVVPAWLRPPGPGALEVRRADVPPVHIDANRATWQEWMLLDGIGETRARRIVAYRESHGPFRSIEDLGRIPAMPEGWAEKARGHLSFGETPRP